MARKRFLIKSFAILAAIGVTLSVFNVAISFIVLQSEQTPEIALHNVSDNLAIEAGTTITADEEILELRAERNAIRLAPNTEITIENRTAPLQVELKKGKLWVYSRAHPQIDVLHKDNSVEILNATASIVASNGTIAVHSLYQSLPINIGSTRHYIATHDGAEIKGSQLFAHTLPSGDQYAQWQKQNTVLDAAHTSTAPEQTESFWLKNTLYAFQKRVTFSEEVNHTVQKALIKNAISEIQSAIKNELPFEDLVSALKSAFAELPEDMREELLHESYLSVSDSSLYYPLLKEIYQEMNKAELATPFVFTLLDHLEESLANKHTQNSELFSQEIKTHISSTNDSSIYQIKDLLLQIILHYSQALSEETLSAFDVVADKAHSVGIKDDEVDNVESHIDILRSKLLIADIIIERNQNFSLALDYLSERELKENIDQISDQQKEKTELQKYLWLIENKAEQGVTNSQVIDNKDFEEYLGNEEYLSELQTILKDTFQEVETEPKKNPNAAEIEAKNIATIVENFAKQEIIIKNTNVHSIAGLVDKYTIQNARYDDIFFSYKYDQENDSVYEIAYDGELLSTTTIARSELASFLDKNILEQRPTMEDKIADFIEENASEKERDKLKKQALKNVFKKWDINVLIRDIQPAAEDVFRISNAELLGTKLNFTFDANTQHASNISMLGESTPLYSDSSIHIEELVVELENNKYKQEERQTLVADLQNLLGQYNLTLKDENVEFQQDAEYIMTFEFTEIERRFLPETMRGTFNIRESLFSSLEMHPLSFEEVTVDQVAESYKTRLIAYLFSKKGFKIDEEETIVENDEAEGVLAVQRLKKKPDDYLSVLINTQDQSFKSIHVNDVLLITEKEWANFDEFSKLVDEELAATR